MVSSCGTSPRFREYIHDLESMAHGREVPDSIEWKRRLLACLDGEPGDVLRREEKCEALRKQGAYFTGAGMATKVANTVAVASDSQLKYFDPTCGAGDLLLGIAKRLPVRGTLEETISIWGERLAGFDISPEFVRATKARLVLLAAKRCGVRPAETDTELHRAFPRIVEADFLSNSTATHLADVVVMNPPFGYASAPNGCTWAQGRVNAAAMFVERAIRDARKGARITAILPDVLRSGSRYARWRDAIGTFGSIRRERSLGIFNRWADVDVYLLDYRVHREKTRASAAPSGSVRRTGVSERFKVHVGPVVPHRHPEIGPEVPYIHARSLPPWGECTRIVESRRFSGRLFRPPLVAVRRTSRPDDKKRAVASLVLSGEPIAVENHLLVLLPNDGTVTACRNLLARLRSGKTDDWINSRLRCRHLTTAVLADMPWWRIP